MRQEPSHKNYTFNVKFNNKLEEVRISSELPAVQGFIVRQGMCGKPKP